MCSSRQKPEEDQWLRGVLRKERGMEMGGGVKFEFS